MDPRPIRLLACRRALFALLALAIAGGSATAQTPELRWDRFHDFEAQVEILRSLERAHPDLVELDGYGESHQGRRLWIVSVTNEATGPLEEKPAVWLDAAYDGGETYTTEIVLYFLRQLLAAYGSDPEVTDILDARGFYLLPNANPDAGEQLYRRPRPGREAGEFMGVSRNAWLLPYDDDGDGQVDEDPPEDLDGDGRILQMRLRDPLGHRITHPEDPRTTLVRRPWQEGEWRLYGTEGVDSDGDGRVNEDWYGGYDTNRNAPAGWDPARILEEVAPYPLYAPEARAFVDALLARPNVYAMVNLHTSGWFTGGTLWVPPSARSPEEFPRYDMDVLFRLLGEEYERILRRAPHSRATAMNSFEGNAVWGRTTGGLMSDFGYMVLGILSWVQENDVRTPDYDGDGQRSELERLRWHERLVEEHGEGIWFPWKPFRHPRLGEVEIGGWIQTNDAHGYAPAPTVPEYAERILPWYLVLAKIAPLVRITEAAAEPLGGDLYRLEATVRNVGVLDTNVTEHGRAVRVAPPTPVRVAVAGESVSVELGEATVEVGHLRGNQPGMVRTMYAPPWQGGSGRRGEARTVEWLLRAPGGAAATVTAWSSKAGTHRVTVPLRPGEATSATR